MPTRQQMINLMNLYKESSYQCPKNIFMKLFYLRKNGESIEVCGNHYLAVNIHRIDTGQMHEKL